MELLRSQEAGPTSLIIQQYLDAAHAQTDDGPEEGGVVARLCGECIGLFKLIVRHFSNPEQDTPEELKGARVSIERSFGRLKLWSDGYGICAGKFDEVFERSSNLRRATLKLLSSISHTLVDRLITLTDARDELSKYDDFEDILRRLKTLVDVAQDDHSDGSSDQTSVDFDSDSIAEVAEDLKTDTLCLMELEPLLKHPILRVNSEKAAAAQEVPPQKAYSDKIGSRFPEAEDDLVAYLGKANFERFLRCCEERKRASEEAVGITEAPHDEVDAIPVAVETISGNIAASSKFNDSGIGTSVATFSAYAETVMSYCGGDGRIRIPPLPAEAKAGEPFPCVACGKTLVILNNRAWKAHLYDDLRPWVCLDLSCSSKDKVFVSRMDWIAHLALDHALEPRWESFQCQLCSEETGPGKIAITKHLGGHLEEISLAALPTDLDFDAESESGSESGSESSKFFENEAEWVGQKDHVGSDRKQGFDIKCVCNTDVGNTPNIVCLDCGRTQHVLCYYATERSRDPPPLVMHYCVHCQPRAVGICMPDDGPVHIPPTEVSTLAILLLKQRLLKEPLTLQPSDDRLVDREMYSVMRSCVNRAYRRWMKVTRDGANSSNWEGEMMRLADSPRSDRALSAGMDDSSATPAPWPTDYASKDLGVYGLACPFRTVDPTTFDRANDPRFEQCHQGISSIPMVIEHMRGSAHGLVTGPHYLSTFGANTGRDRPLLCREAGLCDICWTSFTDSAEFSRHNNRRPCREAQFSDERKFLILVDTFCVSLAGDSAGSGDQDPLVAEPDKHDAGWEAQPEDASAAKPEFRMQEQKGDDVTVEKDPLTDYWEAFSFVSKVKKRFEDQPDVYASFLAALRRFDDAEISKEQVVGEISSLFSFDIELRVEFEESFLHTLSKGKHPRHPDLNKVSESTPNPDILHVKLQGETTTLSLPAGVINEGHLTVANLRNLLWDDLQPSVPASELVLICDGKVLVGDGVPVRDFGVKSKSEISVLIPFKTGSGPGEEAGPGAGQGEPVRLRDALGRKFSFPFHICKSWKDMDDLIRQAFLQQDVLRPLVEQGKYDIVNDDDRQIILPSAWGKVVRPGSSLTMRMWPTDRPMAPADAKPSPTTAKTTNAGDFEVPTSPIASVSSEAGPETAPGVEWTMDTDRPISPPPLRRFLRQPERRPEDDIIMLSARGEVYPLHWPTFSITSGSLRIRDIWNGAKETLGLLDSQRHEIRFIHKGNVLADDLATAYDCGLRDRDEVTMVMGGKASLVPISSENPYQFSWQDVVDSLSNLSPEVRENVEAQAPELEADLREDVKQELRGILMEIMTPQQRGAYRERGEDPLETWFQHQALNRLRNLWDPKSRGQPPSDPAISAESANTDTTALPSETPTSTSDTKPLDIGALGEAVSRRGGLDGMAKSGSWAAVGREIGYIAEQTTFFDAHTRAAQLRAAYEQTLPASQPPEPDVRNPWAEILPRNPISAEPSTQAAPTFTNWTTESAVLPLSDCDSLTIGSVRYGENTSIRLGVYDVLNEGRIRYLLNYATGDSHRIEYPYSSIRRFYKSTSMNFRGVAIELHRAPFFYRRLAQETNFSPVADFTKDQQATSCLIHRLSGDPEHLRGVLFVKIGYLAPEVMGDEFSTEKGAAERSRAPFCKCVPPQLAIRRKVTKKGPNLGRWFYACPLRPQTQCNFFKWEHATTVDDRAQTVDGDTSEASAATAAPHEDDNDEESWLQDPIWDQSLFADPRSRSPGFDAQRRAEAEVRKQLSQLGQPIQAPSEQTDAVEQIRAQQAADTRRWPGLHQQEAAPTVHRHMQLFPPDPNAAEIARRQMELFPLGRKDQETSEMPSRGQTPSPQSGASTPPGPAARPTPGAGPQLPPASQQQQPQHEQPHQDQSQQIDAVQAQARATQLQALQQQQQQQHQSAMDNMILPPQIRTMFPRFNSEGKNWGDLKQWLGAQGAGPVDRLNSFLSDTQALQFKAQEQMRQQQTQAQQQQQQQPTSSVEDVLGHIDQNRLALYRRLSPAAKAQYQAEMAATARRQQEEIQRTMEKGEALYQERLPSIVRAYSGTLGRVPQSRLSDLRVECNREARAIVIEEMSKPPEPLMRQYVPPEAAEQFASGPGPSEQIEAEAAQSNEGADREQTGAKLEDDEWPQLLEQTSLLAEEDQLMAGVGAEPQSHFDEPDSGPRSRRSSMSVSSSEVAMLFEAPQDQNSPVDGTLSAVEPNSIERNALVDKGIYSEDDGEDEDEGQSPRLRAQSDPPAGELRYACNECSLAFDSLHKLNHHLGYHSRPFGCPHCDKKFGNQTHLDRHVSDKHLGGTSKFHCTVEGCQYSRTGGRGFPRQYNWRRHMVNKHGITPDLEPLTAEGPHLEQDQELPPLPSPSRHEDLGVPHHREWATIQQTPMAGPSRDPIVRGDKSAAEDTSKVTQVHGLVHESFRPNFQHLSPVDEMRTPSPTVFRKLDLQTPSSTAPMPTSIAAATSHATPVDGGATSGSFSPAPPPTPPRIFTHATPYNASPYAHRPADPYRPITTTDANSQYLVPTSGPPYVAPPGYYHHHGYSRPTPEPQPGFDDESPNAQSEAAAAAYHSPANPQ